MPTEFVTRYELAAHLEPIKDDLGEVKRDVKLLVADKYGAAWLGGKGHALFIAVIPALVASVVTILLFFIH